MFRFSESTTYVMPAHFGGSFEGPPPASTYHDVTNITVRYETDPSMLARYVPEAFELAQPLVVVQYGACRGVDWLAGGGYDLVTVATPVVHARERVAGMFALVVWENKTDPILSGREFTGIPKIFADIEDHHQLGDTLFTTVSREGSTFLRIEARRTRALAAEELSALNQESAHANLLGWRYIPNVGRPGAALSHAIVFPHEIVHRAAWLAEGSVRWEALPPEQHPTQAHIVRALRELPVQAYRNCMVTHCSTVLRSDLARQLE